ncbi:MAG: PEP-CTERM sorting domain-containing protein [Armatimonadetes bacterium]|nr:PEP-CTERM sorting domain-containing protein [Armatimonadota bacterium]
MNTRMALIGAAGLAILSSGSASASIVITTGGGNFAGDENVQFNHSGLPNNDFFVQGVTNDSALYVDFYDPVEALHADGGQSRIEPLSAPALTDVTISMASEGLNFLTLIINLEVDQDGSVTFTTHRKAGADDVQTFAVSDHGNNKFRVEAVADEMIWVRLTSSDADIQDVQQVRIGGFVPEPASLACLGIGLLMLRRRGLK